MCERGFRPERLNRRLALGAIFAYHENVHAVAFVNRPFREIIPANERERGGNSARIQHLLDEAGKCWAILLVACRESVVLLRQSCPSRC